MSSNEHPTPEDAERRFRELLENADLRQPDEIRYEPAEDELVCFWEEEKVVIVIELSEPLPAMPPV